MTQNSVADAIGVTYQQVQKYETGRSGISAGRLRQIAKILKVPVSFFFEGAPRVAGRPTLRGNAPSADYVDKFLATSEGLALVLAMTRLNDAKLRRRIVALVEAIETRDAK